MKKLERLVRLLLDQCEKNPEAFLVSGRVDAFLENAYRYNFDAVEAKVLRVV